MDRKQITLRIPDKVYEALKGEAADMGLSVNELILLKVNPLGIRYDKAVNQSSISITPCCDS